MNPLLMLLICFPLVIVLIADIFAIIGTFKGVDLKGTVIVLSVISAALIFLLLRMVRNPRIVVGKEYQASSADQTRITNWLMGVVYIVIAICLFAVIRPYSLRYWVGTITCLLALVMIYLTVIDLYRGTGKQLNLNNKDQSDTNFDPRTRAFLIIWFILLIGFSFLGFQWLNIDEYISIFDLDGIVLLLCSLIFWLSVTKKKDKNVRDAEGGVSRSSS
jgi:hypothetical protein